MNDENRFEVFQLQAEFCKSLADPKRLMIIHELREGEKSVNELAERLGLKQSNTSQHLAVLRKAGIIAPRREGNIVHYDLANPKIGQACDLVQSFIAEQLRSNQDLASIM
ncbi:MAG: winged helix-turn-helix transcriptional regulator [Chloroflexi bacterium]|jgi:ArsR family transcriptional regulator, virulence genes transcriptional regulator|nr:winged helix-turn-helix transcriptional regulator [Chloroflexota bacterium]